MRAWHREEKQKRNANLGWSWRDNELWIHCLLWYMCLWYVLGDAAQDTCADVGSGIRPISRWEEEEKGGENKERQEITWAVYLRSMQLRDGS